ncbi:MAG: PspC domain-containing protein [Butyrivibrio sp.]|nr:PspC domain-containing protein [Butyrivibrio sp.]
MEKKLYRSNDRKIFGVCGGVAEYFGWDPDVVRVIWAITAVSTGIGIPAYIVATFLMDNRPDYVSRYDGDKKE